MRPAPRRWEVPMRFVFIGSGTLAVLTGRMLAERRH